MRYYQFTAGCRLHVGVETARGRVVDLTALSPHVTSVLALLKAAAVAGSDVDAVAGALAKKMRGPAIALKDLFASSEEGKEPRLAPPLLAPEVWAAGVTYQDSMRERQAESGTPDVYAKVYAADRPEVFFKATAERIVPPFGQVGIRKDSTWDVPEPELAFVMFGGGIAGYTCGNDMSSRSIEGANPLYLPQAKIYDRSCSIGPCFVTPEVAGNAQKLRVQLTIERRGRRMFQGESSTSKMKRTCADIADWLQRHNPVPDGTTVLTGTGIIPPPGFTLKAGDRVTIEIENIGALVNTVVVV
jgi:2-dehydro-3-deoxy-D-arabinonate dehydratase